MTTRAELFFQQVVAQEEADGGGYAFLASLVGPQDQADENEWRDFKAGHVFNTTVRETMEKAQAIWSETLSAFANAGGGVLIWGIDAPKRLAEQVKLVPDAIEFAERLRKWVPDTTEPPVLEAVMHFGG